MLGPLLAPLSDGGTFISTRMKRNVADLAHGRLSPAELAEALESNPALREQLQQYGDQQIRGQLLAYEQYMIEQQRQLNEIADLRGNFQDFPCTLVPAKVIGGDANPLRDTRLISPASKVTAHNPVTTRGLAVQSPTALPGELAVLSSSALVGRVAESGAWTARLQTVCDAGFQTAVTIKRDPANPRKIQVDQQQAGRVIPVEKALDAADPWVPAILHGDGRGLTSSELPAYHKVLPGDWVYTAGNDPRLPMPVLVGVVAAVHPVETDSNHCRLEVRPAADLATLRDVYVVIPKWAGGR
jgi:cell shape-determining protein MreC